MRILAALLCLAIAGCATTAPCVPTIETKTVQVQVRMPCLDAEPPEPAWAVALLKPDASDFEVAQAYRIERRQREQYVKDLKTAAAGCAVK